MKNLLVFLFSFGLFLWSCHSVEKVKLNVIVIMADDLGYETIAINGGESYETPEIDRLASEGIRFEHCYAQPLCTPSRVKIMTGIYNVHNYVEFGYLDTSQTTFGHLFQAAGYETCVVGKWQLGKDLKSPVKAGFKEYCLWQVTKGRTDSMQRDSRFSQPVLETNGVIQTHEGEAYGPEYVSDYGLNFIERSVASDRPFLLYYPMILTHCPFSPTPDSEEWSSDTSAVMSYKGDARYFGDMLAFTDKIIGRINRKLIELGIEQNTLILFTGDNGTDVPVISRMEGRDVAGAKGQSTDAGTRVPLIVKWPSGIQKGQVLTDLVDLSDVLPTICEAANVPIPNHERLDGKSFLPQLKGEKGQPREWVYNWYSRSGKEENARVFVRNHRFKLYDTGEFYEIPLDYKEQNAIPLDSLSNEALTVHSNFRETLDYYKGRRLKYVDAH